MACFYRLLVFGKPAGPWRSRQAQVRQDAAAKGVGQMDEDGQFYLDGYADVEWIHEDALRRRA